MFRRLRFDFAYFFRPRWDTGISPPELLEYVAAHPPGRAVDLGCGTGTNLITLARKGWQVTGVELSRRALKLAQRKIQRAGVAAVLIAGDLSKRITLQGTFDLALDVGCFHGVADRRQYLDNLTTMLRGGGHWLMYGFIPSRPTGFGLEGADIAAAGSRGLKLVWRTDGAERSGRPSAWFLLEKSCDSG